MQAAIVARSVLEAERSSWFVGVLVGGVVVRRELAWPVSWDVVVAVDTIPRIGWKDMAGLSLPCAEGYAAAPMVPRQMLDPLDPLIYEFCFPGTLAGEPQMSCPHCDALLTVPVNDPNGEESYECCQCQKGLVVDWVTGRVGIGA